MKINIDINNNQLLNELYLLLFWTFRYRINAVNNSRNSESFKLEVSNKSRKDEAYDPYLERNHVEHSLTNNETTIHLLKSSLGTGILAMPKAYYHAGYIVGSIGTIAIGSIAVYCIQLLLKIHYELCKRNKVCLFVYMPYHKQTCVLARIVKLISRFKAFSFKFHLSTAREKPHRNDCFFYIHKPNEYCLTGPVYGLPNNSKKCFTGRTSMDAQVCSVYCVMNKIHINQYLFMQITLSDCIDYS